jgi:hypothetical protein
MYDTYEAGFEKSKIGKYKTVTKRKRSRKLQLEETEDFDTTFEGKENFWVNTYLVIIDRLLSEIKRKKLLKEFHGKFEFMNNILERDKTQLLNGAITLQQYYKDLEEFVCDEIIQFKAYMSNEIKIPSLGDMYRVLLENHIQEIFPSLEIALRIFLSTAATNCSAERSFSLLKRFKSYLRSSMSQDRVKSLAVLHMNSDITKQLDYEYVIHDFATKKARRKPLVA